jgi:hypothetical protein
MGPTALLPLRRKWCSGFLSSLKIHRPRSGSNTRTLGPVASTLATFITSKICQLLVEYQDFSCMFSVNPKRKTIWFLKLISQIPKLKNATKTFFLRHEFTQSIRRKSASPLEEKQLYIYIFNYNYDPSLKLRLSWWNIKKKLLIIGLFVFKPSRKQSSTDLNWIKLNYN